MESYLNLSRVVNSLQLSAGGTSSTPMPILISNVKLVSTSESINTQRKFVCSECSIAFKKQALLQDHECTAHKRFNFFVG